MIVTNPENTVFVCLSQVFEVSKHDTKEDWSDPGPVKVIPCYRIRFEAAALSDEKIQYSVFEYPTKEQRDAEFEAIKLKLS